MNHPFPSQGPPNEADAEEELRSRGRTHIRVSPEESAAIDRLKGMGFPEALVIEVGHSLLRCA